MRALRRWRFPLLIVLAVAMPAFAQWQDPGVPADPSAAWYGPVRAGEDLGHIAEVLHRAPEIALEQVMVAIYQANPAAFLAADLHSLRAGARLRVPTAEEIAAVPRDEAMLWVHGGRVLLPAESSPEELGVQLKQVETLNTTLHSEREALRQRVAAMEEQVKALSRHLVSPDQSRAPEVEETKRESRTTALGGLLVAAILVVLAGWAFWRYRRSAAKASP